LSGSMAFVMLRSYGWPAELKNCTGVFSSFIPGDYLPTPRALSSRRTASVTCRTLS
jgi:hypothetical protein